ncbi:MAG: carbamoyltransferase HypF, partial [Thermodesulfovibrionia bacterium]|nr:carbamoyltransferase HypF [Thermodesulfovibrionia bacterium]
VRSQHHHAHITSVMAENSIKDEEVLGIALDGAGYGADGQIWGGEVLKSTYLGYKRVGQLEYIPMPGGDLCAYYPYRMLISALTKQLSDDEIRDITANHIDSALPHGTQERDIILNHARREGVLLTSSSGRFLDSISAIIGTSYYRTYEGEPAMLLEALANRGNPDTITYSPEINEINDKLILKTSNTLYNLLKNKNKHKKEDIAAYGQKYLAYGLTDMVKYLRDSTGINKVALSGGVFVNDYITSTIMNRLETDGFEVYRNTKVPPGDGGTALGQVVNALHHVI